MLERLTQLIDRLGAYPWWEIAIEFVIIWVVVLAVVRFVQGTRAAGALKGLLVLLVMGTLLVRILAQRAALERLVYLYDTFLTLAAITLIVVFQPELRRGLIRLGERQLFRRSAPETRQVIDAVVDAVGRLAKAQFGAIIVIERESGLRGLVEGGTTVGAEVSSRLLQTIFFPGAALHDLAVIIRGSEVVAAGVQLPLADPDDMPDATLGSRHRAAVGLTKECDALVVVVSEENGTVSLAERGRLDRGLSPETLQHALTSRLRRGSGADEVRMLADEADARR